MDNAADKKEKGKEDFAFQNAKASLEIDGGVLPDGGEELILKSVRGEISEEEFLKQALSIAYSAKKKDN